MARWEPDAIERLQDAAMVLFRRRGYEQTTVAEIAERAGLTRRTFFRHFPDKREVLFSGADSLGAFLARNVVDCPASASAMEAVAAGLDAVARAADGRSGFADFARERHALIRACAELRERELIKLASLGAAMADALRRRGVPDAAARLAAGAGLTIFQVAFDEWVDDAGSGTLREHVARALRGLRAVASTHASRQRDKAGRKVSRGDRPRPPPAARSKRR